MTSLAPAESFEEFNALPDPLREPLIYGAVSPATLLSRAWNLLRYHLKSSILLMLIPAFLGVMGSLVMLVPTAASQIFEMPSYISFIIAVCLGLLLTVMAVIVRLTCMAALSRLYLKTLMHGEGMSLREAFKKSVLKSRASFVAMFLMFGVIVVLMALFILLDIFAFTVGVIGFYILSGILLISAVIPNIILQLAFGLLALILFILGATLISLCFVSLLSVQAGLCLFPVVGMANTDQRGFFVILESALKSYGLLGANIFRMILFAILLFVIYMVLSVAMSLPLQTWFILEMIFNPPAGDPTNIPLHKSLLMTIYQAMTFSVIWPYIFAAITVFWYDCRVRSEALDIRLSLHRMNERLKSKTRVIK